MPSKQQEFYSQLRQETENKVLTYQEFAKQIESIKASSAQRIKDLKADMKFLAKQIDESNKKLKEQGQTLFDTEKIECPDSTDPVFKKDCDACKSRLGCPAWE